MIQNPLDPKSILHVLGPPIVKFKIQSKDVNILNQQCDELISNKKYRKQFNVSDKLSKTVKGDIQEELTCELKNNKMNSFRKTLYDAVEFLYKNKFNFTQPNMELDIHNAWYVRSFEGDFNPLHNHTEYYGGQKAHPFSCVGYLKVPDGITDENKSGYIEFFENGGGYAVKPNVGDLYLFPSSLHHTVYPFRGKGERRSFSSNINVRLL